METDPNINFPRGGREGSKRENGNKAAICFIIPAPLLLALLHTFLQK